MLLSFDPETMRQIVAEGGVDLREADGELLIEKASLRELQEGCWMLLACGHKRRSEPGVINPARLGRSPTPVVGLCWLLSRL